MRRFQYEIIGENVACWTSDYIFYCTNRDGEGLFRVDSERNERMQILGTCDFSVKGLTEAAKKKKIRKAILDLSFLY